MISIATASWIGLAFLLFHIYMIFSEKNKSFKKGLIMAEFRIADEAENKKKYAIKFVQHIYKAGGSYEERVGVMLAEISDGELTNEKLNSLINKAKNPHPQSYVIDIQRIA